MNEVFVDTSALYALLVETDDNHRAARTAASSFRDRDARLVTSSFVVLETVTLLQTRAGIAAVRIFYRDVLPLLTVAWVGEEHLHRAMAALLGASKRGVSLTDWSSITLMRERGIAHIFAFDEDFARPGFEIVPASAHPEAPG